MISIRKLVAVLIFVVPNAALAEWTTVTKVDSMTNEVRKSAFVENSLGHRFSVYRIPSDDNRVWGNFAISQKVFDLIDGEKLIQFRIDKHDAKDLRESVKLQKLMQRLGETRPMYEWKPKWVNFVLWHGDKEEGVSPAIENLKNGNTLKVRYYLSKGGYKDTEFSLKGAKNAIDEALLL